MSASWVKSVATAQTSGTTVSSNITPTNAGDLITADVYDGNGSAQNGDTVSDGTSYGQDGFRGLLTDGDTVMVYSRPNVPASALTVVATRTGTGGSFRLTLSEYTGVVTSSPRDGAAVTGYSAGGGTAISTPNLTPTQTGDVLHGVVGTDSAMTSAVGASGFTVETNQFTSTQSIASCDQILAGSGATPLAMTISGSTEWASVLVAYKASGGGGGPTPHLLSTLGCGA